MSAKTTDTTRDSASHSAFEDTSRSSTAGGRKRAEQSVVLSVVRHTRIPRPGADSLDDASEDNATAVGVPLTPLFQMTPRRVRHLHRACRRSSLGRGDVTDRRAARAQLPAAVQPPDEAKLQVPIADADARWKLSGPTAARWRPGWRGRLAPREIAAAVCSSGVCSGPVA
jgi:hypothetical protein